MLAVVRMIGCGALLMVVFSGCSGGSVEMPTSYESWNAKDGTFRLDYPANWKAAGGGKQGIQWATFTSGGAEIRVSVDRSSSLINDIMDPTGAGMDEDLPEELAPVAQVHEMKRDVVAADMSAYKEDDPIKFETKLGEGRKSAFSASVGLGRKIKGYRATVISRERGINILCKGPVKSWEKLQPVFDKVLDSLDYGTPER